MQSEAVTGGRDRIGIFLKRVLEALAVQVGEGKVAEIHGFRGDVQKLEYHVLEAVTVQVPGRVGTPQMPAEIPPFIRITVRSLVFREPYPRGRAGGLLRRQRRGRFRLRRV